MARQIDSVQNYLRQQDTSFSSAQPPSYSVVSVQRGSSSLSPFLAAAQQQLGGAGVGRITPPIGPRESRDLVPVGSVIKSMTVRHSLDGQKPR